MPAPLIAMIVTALIYILWPAPPIDERMRTPVTVPSVISDGEDMGRGRAPTLDVAITTRAVNSFPVCVNVNISTDGVKMLGPCAEN